MRCNNVVLPEEANSIYAGNVIRLVSSCELLKREGQMQEKIHRSGGFVAGRIIPTHGACIVVSMIMDNLLSHVAGRNVYVW